MTNWFAGIGIQPYYQDESVIILHGDCHELLPRLPKGIFDLLITDPPYGVKLNTDNTRFRQRNGRQHGHISKLGNKIGSNSGRPLTGDDEVFDPRFLLQYGTHQVIWGWNHFPDQLPRGTCLVWVKRNDDAFGKFLSDAELAWMSKGHGVYLRRDLSNNAIWQSRIHPTQKPLTLMKWCLSFFPNANMVIDPFMGSGTTLRACKDLGLYSVGIEIEERYCKLAAERMHQEAMTL